MFTIENKKSEKITIRQHPNMQPFEMIKNVEDDELDSCHDCGNLFEGKSYFDLPVFYYVSIRINYHH